MENKATVKDVDLMANFKKGFDEGQMIQAQKDEDARKTALFNLLVFRATKKIAEIPNVTIDVILERVGQYIQSDTVYAFEVTPAEPAQAELVSDDDVVDAEVVD